MPPPLIAIINESGVPSAADVAALAEALQVQVTRDFAPIWGRDAMIAVVGPGKSPPKGSWWLALLDDADQAGALGYHEQTSGGQPIGKVFCRTTKAIGGNWTVTASHELLEMLGDPYVNLCADVSGDSGMEIYAYEDCDACEDDQFGYEIGGVRVSDFVTPEWFNPASPKGTRLDFKGHIDTPLQLLPGGYIGIRTSRGWSQLTPDGSPHHSSSHAFRGGRWTRRKMALTEYRRSTAHA